MLYIYCIYIYIHCFCRGINDGVDKVKSMSTFQLHLFRDVRTGVPVMLHYPQTHLLFRPLGRMWTPPAALPAKESAYGREVGTMERLRNYMDPK